MVGPRPLRSGLAAITLALVMVAASSGCAATQSRSSGTGLARRVGSIALGVNVAAWDNIYAVTRPGDITKLLEAAGLRLIRYPGWELGRRIRLEH